MFKTDISFEWHTSVLEKTLIRSILLRKESDHMT